MVNVFLVYSGSDKEKALEIGNYLERNMNPNENDSFSNAQPDQSSTNRHIKILAHTHQSANWKKDVKNLIQKSNVVLFIQGENSAFSVHIQWEIETSLNMNKLVMVCQLGDYALPEWLIKREWQPKLVSKIKQGFSVPSWPFLMFIAKDTPLARVFTKEEIKNKIDRFDAKNYDIFSENIDKMREDQPEETLRQLFEQYKIYQKTSEELVARRQAVNNFYLTINTALLTFCGVVIGWANIPEINKWVVLVIAALAGFLFNTSWCATLDQLKIINTAKLRLINSIEQQLPLKLYYEEYKIMKDERNPWTYKNSSKDEKKSPYIFNMMYVGLIIFFAFVTLSGILSYMPPV